MTLEKTFNEWMEAVDAAVWRLTGELSVYDLPDFCYADWHADGETPVATARAAIRYAKGDED